MSFTFNGLNRTITEQTPAGSPAIATYDVLRDLWSAAEVWWDANQQWRFPFRQSGGGLRRIDDLGNRVYATADIYLQNQAGMNWRIVPASYPHTIVFTGANLYLENPNLPMLSSNVAGVFVQFDYSDVQSSYVMESGGGGTVNVGAIAQAVQQILSDDFAALPTSTVVAQAVQAILVDEFASIPSSGTIAQAVDLILTDNFAAVPSVSAIAQAVQQVVSTGVPTPQAIAQAVRTAIAPELGQITEQRNLEGLNPQVPLVVNRWTQGGIVYTTRVAGNITQTITQTTQGETTTITVQRTT